MVKGRARAILRASSFTMTRATEQSAAPQKAAANGTAAKILAAFEAAGYTRADPAILQPA
jgi:hypothetical protein